MTEPVAVAQQGLLELRVISKVALGSSYVIPTIAVETSGRMNIKDVPDNWQAMGTQAVFNARNFGDIDGVRLVVINGDVSHSAHLRSMFSPCIAPISLCDPTSFISPERQLGLHKQPR